MPSVFWVLMPSTAKDRKYGGVFVGTRTTKAAAIKLATKELCSNKWGTGWATVFEAKYDAYGNRTGTIEYTVTRMGRVSNEREVDGYYSDKDAFIHNLRKQYSGGVKRDIEPPMYSLLRML